MTNSESTGEGVADTEVTGDEVTSDGVVGEETGSEETGSEETGSEETGSEETGSERTARESPDPDERVATLARLRRVQAAAVDHALTADAARAAFRFVGSVERLRAARDERTRTSVGGETPVSDEVSSSAAAGTDTESWQRDLLSVALAAVAGSSSVADAPGGVDDRDETAVSSEVASAPGEEGLGDTGVHPEVSPGDTGPSIAEWHSRPDAASLGAAVAHARFDAALTNVAAAVDRRPETVARLAARVARHDSLPAETASSTTREEPTETTDEGD